MMTVMAAPAFAFHHAFLPGGTRSRSENAAGNDPTATGAIVTNNPAQGQALPLPPTGTPEIP
jgi:hypothetical protein